MFSNIESLYHVYRYYNGRLWNVINSDFNRPFDQESYNVDMTENVYYIIVKLGTFSAT